MKQFNFVLPGLKGGEKLTLSIDGVNYPLFRHTEETRSRAKKSNAAMSMMTDAQLSRIGFYAKADAGGLSPDHLHRLLVTSEPGKNDGFTLPVLHHFSFYIPAGHKREYIRKVAADNKRDGFFWDAKLSWFDLDFQAARFLKGGAEDEEFLMDANLDIDLLLTPMEIAKSLLFEHPDLANAQPYTASIVMNGHIAPPRLYNPEQYQRLYDFATAISKQGPDKWAYRAYAMNQKTGRPMEYEYDIPALGHTKGDKVEIYDLSDETLKGARGSLKGALASASSDELLRSQSWRVNAGKTADRYTAEDIAADTRNNIPGENVEHGGKNGVKWVVKENTPHHGLSVRKNSIKLEDNKFQIDVLNSYLRTLGSFTQSLDDKGNPFGDKKFCTVVGPVDTLMGIPLPFAATTIETELPAEAAGVRMYFGGLGISGYDAELCVQGIVLTSIFQLGIPTFFLAANTGLASTKVLTDSMEDAEFMMEVIDLILSLVQAPVYGEDTAGVICDWLQIAAETIGGILVTKLLENILTWIIMQITAQQAITCLPMAGWILRIANVVMDVAQLTQTVAEVCTSPAVLTADVSSQMDLKVTVKPDPDHAEEGFPETAVWPAVANHWQLNLNYKGGTSKIMNGRFPAETSKAPVLQTFTEVPAGGSLKVSLQAYSETGWLCGSYESDWMQAKPDKETGIMSVSGNIKEVLVPLTQSVQYEHKEKLTYDAQAGYAWKAGAAPGETMADIGKEGKESLKRLIGITYNSAFKQVGYVWSASGKNLPPVEGEKRLPVEYLVQNISTLADEDVNKRYKTSEIGFAGQPSIIYDKFGTGRENYILDTRNGTCHLRKIDLMDGTGGFGFSDSRMLSYGRFMQDHLDALVLHPDGVLVGVNWKNSKMELLKLPEEPSQDRDAAEAQLVSGEGFREGLLNGPVAVKISQDGRILILESGNRRLQGFDVQGNPVPGFTGHLLFETPPDLTKEIKKDLNDGKFTETMMHLFHKTGLVTMCTLNDVSLAKELDEAKVTAELIRQLGEKGVYLYWEEDDPSSSARARVVKKGSIWLVEEPVRGSVYMLELLGGKIAVFNGLSQMEVTRVKKDNRWILNDLASGKAYLALADTKGNDTKEETVTFFEYLSFMKLYDSGTDDTYLDFCVEHKGYLYVLSYEGAGSRVEDYHLDIYEPDGTFLVRTPDERLSEGNPQFVSAAKIEVDEFRSLLALNFERITGKGGKPEPSISKWTPTTPVFSLDMTHEKELEEGDIVKIKETFSDHSITLPDTAVLTKPEKGVYRISDGVTVPRALTKVEYDIILCVDEYQVYKIVKKEEA